MKKFVVKRQTLLVLRSAKEMDNRINIEARGGGGGVATFSALTFRKRARLRINLSGELLGYRSGDASLKWMAKLGKIPSPLCIF